MVAVTLINLILSFALAHSATAQPIETVRVLVRPDNGEFVRIDADRAAWTRFMIVGESFWSGSKKAAFGEFEKGVRVYVGPMGRLTRREVSKVRIPAHSTFGATIELKSQDKIAGLDYVSPYLMFVTTSIAPLNDLSFDARTVDSLLGSPIDLTEASSLESACQIILAAERSRVPSK